MSAIVNAAAHRLEGQTGGVATNAANLSMPQPPYALATSGVELLDALPTEFGGLTHLFGGGTPGETAGQYAPVNVGLEQPGGSVRGPLGGLVPDLRNAAQKVQAAIATPAPWDPAGQLFRPGPGPVPSGGGWWARIRQWFGG